MQSFQAEIMCDGYAYLEVMRKEIKTMTQHSTIWDRIGIIPSRESSLISAGSCNHEK